MALSPSGRIRVNVTGARGKSGGIGPAGTISSNSGFVGPVAISPVGTQPLVTRSSDGATVVSISVGAPYVSVAGTRASVAPRIVGGNGADSNFDSFITSNCVARGDTLFRDEFQSACDFRSLNGAHCDFDGFSLIAGSQNINHARMFQARNKIALTGGAQLSEWTGNFVQPIFNGTFTIGQLAALWVRDAQVDSGTQTIYASYGVLIEDCQKWGQNFSPFASFTQKLSYSAGGWQFGPNADIYGAREVRAGALHGTGLIATFQGGGGVAIYAPSGGPGIINGYANAGGVPRNLAINANGGSVVVGATVGTVGVLFEVAGRAYAQSHRSASFTVATVPSANSHGPGATIYVSNEAGGAVPAFSDGTNWLRVTDRAVIS